MIHFKKFLLSEKNSDEEITDFLTQYGDIIPKDNLYINDNYFCGFWDDASDDEKAKKAVQHQLKRDLLQLEVQYVQKDREYKIAKAINTAKGKNPDAVLNAKDNMETLENQIQWTKEKLSELNG